MEDRLRRLVVPIWQSKLDQLAVEAREQRRHPRDQAAVMLEKALAERTDRPVGTPAPSGAA
jgi:hypothetical protein